MVVVQKMEFRDTVCDAFPRRGYLSTLIATACKKQEVDFQSDKEKQNLKTSSSLVLANSPEHLKTLTSRSATSN